ncbi:phenylalanine--tRNA ligase subunit alpha, partial [Patescibacteria group bacterium]|nr:phenylalanine--tRNA ligase subunit alpha [Patescibacteria group bacterium]
MGAPNTFKTIHEEATAKIAAAKTREQLDQLRTDFLGRKGTLTTALREISELPDAKRKAAGKRGNTIKQELDTAFRDAIAALSGQSKTEAVDITLPGALYPRGHVHPVSMVLEDIERVFTGMGFSIAEGPEVE